ncbi:MAG: tRNA (adenosine(37)-N6)-threonylcarbamoyltransferase complex ATPase subunit type 1 TsaE [Dehalococcoidales bacterium]|nr:MAG: tRNA (adenosine(37)-N6)-threonylcarbamoyltransferase complex ATPase subunit type 1 TsaE [Dehalococcoidales bacterium]
MEETKITSHSPEQTQELGKRIGRLSQPGDVILLVGELGTGKTCLTQGIAWGLDIEEYALSPSFVIMRELYGRLPLYHIDLYRLDHIEESIDLGLDDYLYGRGICVVEWAEKAMGILPREHLLIEIDYINDTGRSFVIKPNGRRYQEIAAILKEHSPST